MERFEINSRKPSHFIASSPSGFPIRGATFVNPVILAIELIRVFASLRNSRSVKFVSRPSFRKWSQNVVSQTLAENLAL
jgi:hypothetical protein